MASQNNLTCTPSKGKLLPAVLSFLAVFAFSFNGTVIENASLINRIIAESHGFGFVFFACAVMLTWISCRYWDAYRNNTCASTKAVAGLFSACMLIGLSYTANSSWDFIFGGKHQFLIAVLVFSGYLYFFDFLVSSAYHFIHEDRLGIFALAGAEKDAASSGKYFLTAFAVIFFGWLVWLIPFMPGSVPHDGANQLRQFFGWLGGKA